MHVPNGFFDAPTSLATAVVAGLAVGVALRAARADLDDRTAPMAGLVATFIFVGQMANFPVAIGTSGHLIGAVLATFLVGPATALLCMSVILIVQALLMADGGLTALGTNIVLMGVVPILVATLTITLARAVTPRVGALAPIAALAAYGSVLLAALAFVGLYAVGGTVPLSLAALVKVMLGVHALIGLGEAAITYLALVSLLKVRPDLVYAARPLLAANPPLIVTVVS